MNDNPSPVDQNGPTAAPRVTPSQIELEATSYALRVLTDTGLWAGWKQALEERGAVVRCSNTECQLDGCTLLDDVTSCMKCFENDAIGPGRCDVCLLYLRRFLVSNDILPEEKVRPFVASFAKRFLGFGSPFSSLSDHSDRALNIDVESGLRDARRQLVNIRRSAPPELRGQLLNLQRTIDDVREMNLKSTAATLRSSSRWMALSRIIRTAIQQLDPDGTAAVDLDLELEMDFEGQGDTIDHQTSVPPHLMPALSTLTRCDRLDILS
ncbi:hypothetical protein CC2G_004345 [Coprinopsis cinerea AmutBmut pab1-1]|nr:hypothetical protein CC2G_004345 [Coprinopsis cinerea AmutBmut pab1-1]